MVALDNNALFGHRPRARGSRLGPLVGAIAIVAVLLVLGAILARGFSENGFRLGSQLAWRYASFVFFAALVDGPAVPDHGAVFCPPSRRRKASAASWSGAFAPPMASICCRSSCPMSSICRPAPRLMTLFGSTVVLVMAIDRRAAGAPGWSSPSCRDKVRKVLLGTAAIYFWLCYSPDGAGAHLRVRTGRMPFTASASA